MFMRKLKTGLRLLGTFLLRILLGIVAAYLWLTGLAFIERTTVGRLSDRYMDGRYDGLRDTVFDIISPIGWYGGWVLIGIAIIWGFSQGRLDIRRWLRKRHA
ncbi:hypothetical protein C6499_02325 [Candidatus Poribacteria bacterium]|nr:MAG: hypothetical protein C6499_02325 [Candidatus Poribacteria bacterium]